MLKTTGSNNKRKNIEIKTVLFSLIWAMMRYKWEIVIYKTSVMRHTKRMFNDLAQSDVSVLVSHQRRNWCCKRAITESEKFKFSEWGLGKKIHVGEVALVSSFQLPLLMLKNTNAATSNAPQILNPQTRFPQRNSVAFFHYNFPTWYIPTFCNTGSLLNHFLLR